jgi:DNA topoisomerase-3
MENAGRELADEDLREQMKDSGLGTPATRAAIIERLIQVRYLRRRGKILAPTEKGIMLIQVLPLALASPETTGRWEKELAQIGRGEADSNQFMSDIRRFVKEIVQDSAHKSNEVIFPQETRTHDPSAPKVSLGKCPLCESDILENTKAYYCSQWRSGCRFTIWKNCAKEQNGPLLMPPQMSILLQKKSVTVPEGTFALVKGKPFVAYTPAENVNSAPEEAADEASSPSDPTPPWKD